MNASPTLDDSGANPVVHSLAVNIIVLGMLAKLYAGKSPSSPVKNWGSEMQHRSITWEGDIYSASPGRQNGEPGLLLTIHRDGHNGGTVRESSFIPMAALDRVTVTL